MIHKLNIVIDSSGNVIHHIETVTDKGNLVLLCI
nr:MAG TPA: hypothetical protein [Caudoviricetes sp.]DAK75273.1 MAG TPA: hypothetical protein [Caudoviricetes sp.]DAZ33378.1 MAG TPA: hypothetical protein [Caudoviricetes sp.]